MATKPAAALILGAGWSAVTGYPLAKDLLAGPIYVANESSRRRVQSVLDAFAIWSATQEWPAPEVFLARVLAQEIPLLPHPQDMTLFDETGGGVLPWPWAVETVELRLAQPDVRPEAALGATIVADRRQHRLRYGAKLSSPVRSRPLINFMRELLARYELGGIVTTNYDTLAERVIRHRPLVHEPEPGFYYGGLPRPQWARGASPWDERYRFGRRNVPQGVQITGTVPLFKLHGSLNWEVGGTKVEVWRDQRLAYRLKGHPAIVPPTPEKVVEPWLQPVWRAAHDVLASSTVWVVVGYSLPDYDLAVRRLFHAAARSGLLQTVVLHDPFAEARCAAWHEVTEAPVSCCEGIGPTAWTVTPPRWWERGLVGQRG